jgi:fucose permease
VGDLLSPATVALVAALSLGWRPLFWLATLVWLVAVAVLWRQRFPRPVATPDDEDALSLLAGLRTALSTPHLLRWTAIALFASMLDEVFLGFAGLYLQNALGAVPVAISLALGAQMVGGLATLVVLDRVAVRWQPERLVAAVAVVTLAGVVMLLSTRSIVLAAAALFVIGAGAAGWYPIAKAQAYALLPGRSGTVRAVEDLGAPFEVALPLVVGALADRFGITAGMSVLGLAPLLVLLVLPRRIKP